MSSDVAIRVRVTPRSSRDAIEAPGPDGVLRVRVSAPPVDGAANRAVIKLIAAALRVPRSSISVASGASSRNKRLRIEGLEADAVLARWPGISLTGRAPG